MEGVAETLRWSPLSLLQRRFVANVDALATRYPTLATQLRSLTPRQDYFVLATNDAIHLGASNGSIIAQIPSTLPPATAQNLAKQLYPAAKCNQPVMIAGEDLGWLWNQLYVLPCEAAAAPGHRPPLYFLIRDLDRFRVLLHLHDWRTMLADTRVRLFTGETAFAKFTKSLVDDTLSPWPKLSVRVDPTLWEGDRSWNDILADVIAQANGKFLSLKRTPPPMANVIDTVGPVFRSGKPLKVLGITSRYTTFLQYSMRDWLAAFERLGHSTQLLIESHDHEICNSLVIASACETFQPDLVVIIDHYRAEFSRIPDQTPVVMWVQDALPNIFRPEAGSAQNRLDYCLGFARLKMIRDFGYPADRYMGAVVACNEERFKPQAPQSTGTSQFACDVSFISHASATAESLLQAEMQKIGSPEANRLLTAIFDQLRAVYDAGGFVTEPIVIERMAQRAMLETHTSLPPSELPKLVDLFSLRINNALFRHQSLHWLAEMGINVHLYGRGWESHPTLKKFARGIADNAEHLAQIYQASKISLQISPHGSVHQRVMEGLAGGGFFLMRYCPGDVMEREFQTIWDWCQANNICNDAELRELATPEIQAAIGRVADCLQGDPFAGPGAFIDTIRFSAEAGYLRSAGSVWGENYDAIVYRSGDELRTKVSHFLKNGTDRVRVAGAMRKVVLDRFTYRATTQQLLEFIANDLAVKTRKKSAA